MDNNLAYFTIGVLVALLIGQQGFWFYIVFKLNDRLMSRDFTEYAQGERIKKPRPVPKASIDAAFDPDAERMAREANQVFSL